MSVEESIKESRQRQLTDTTNFDKHMIRARLRDIASRMQIFTRQTTDNVERRNVRQAIPSSTY